MKGVIDLSLPFSPNPCPPILRGSGTVTQQTEAVPLPGTSQDLCDLNPTPTKT